MTSSLSSPDHSAGPPAIVISDDGSVAGVDRAPPEVLEALLVERRGFRADGGGLRRLSEPEHLFDLDPDGGATFLSGLVPRVEAAARRAGYPVEIRDEAEPVTPAAPSGARGELDEDLRGLADRLEPRRRGVVLVRSGRDRLRAIELIVRMFPRGRVVVAKTRREARQIVRHLGASLDEPIDFCTRGLTLSEIRVRVGTEGSLDLALGSVVVFADATSVLHERLRPMWRVLRRQRVYGMLDDGLRPGRRERLVIEGYVGPVIARLGPADDRPAAVRAVFAAWTGPERPDQPLGLEWKKNSMWTNDARNESIARLATALAAGEAAVPWQYGLFVDDQADLRTGEGRRVVVLVEVPEHARALARLLPGWAVRCADGAGRGDGDRALGAGSVPADGEVLPGRAIVTWLYAGVRGRLAADVVVRADGTPWPLDIELVAPGPGDEYERLVLLVDLDDHQDRTARDAARARRRDYRDRGWSA
jgi:hypothetical protein